MKSPKVHFVAGAVFMVLLMMAFNHAGSAQQHPGVPIGAGPIALRGNHLKASGFELSAFVATGPANRLEFPQFLGPNRNATLKGRHLASGWDRQPPIEVWRHSMGTGWSGFAVADGLAVTQEEREGRADAGNEAQYCQLWKRRRHCRAQ